MKTTRTRRRGITLVLVLGTAPLLSGCLGTVAHTVDDADFRLNRDTVAIVGFGPQISDISPWGGGNRSYLVAIDSDGTSSVLRTAAIAGLAPNWDGNAVYSRDPKGERTTTATGTRVRAETKDVLQIGAYTGVDDYTSIEQFDLGLTKEFPDGQQLIRARRADGTVEEAVVPGSAFSPVACASGLYATGENLDSRNPDSRGDSPTTLIREFPRPADSRNPQADVVSRAAPGTVQGSGNAVCQNNIIYQLGTAGAYGEPSTRAEAGLEDPESNLATPYLRSWDTATGEITAVPVTRTDGLPLNPDAAMTGDGAIVNGELYWFSPIGTVFATDLRTGSTRVALTTTPEPVNVDPPRGPGHGSDGAKDDGSDDAGAGYVSFAVRFGGGKVYVIRAPQLGVANGALGAWDLRTGNQTLDIAVPAIREITAEMGNVQHPWGLAIRPTLLEDAELVPPTAAPPSPPGKDN